MSEKGTNDARVNRAPRPVQKPAAQRAPGARPAGVSQRGAVPVRRPAGAPPHRPRPGKKKGHAVSLIAALVIVALAVVLVVVLVNRGGDTGGSANPSPATKAPIDTTDQGTAFADILASVNANGDAAASGGNTVTVTDLSVKEGLDEKWLNVLLLGADAREANVPARTDTMMICSINKQTGDVKLSSIMRDTAVSFEGHKNARINTAYYYGGAKLAVKVVNEYFGMNIQNYVYVDFTGFAGIAEALGGIDIDITENEMNSINQNLVEQYFILINQGKMSYEDAEAEYYATMLKQYGKNVHLNGMQTLGYARIRKLDSDFARAERQRAVLNKLMTGMKDSSVVDLMGLFAKCNGFFSTSLSMNEIMDIASLVLNRANFALASELRLPISGSYKEEVRNEDAMLYDMDTVVNQRELYNFIYR